MPNEVDNELPEVPTIEFDVEKAFAEARAKARHVWRQQGPHLVCKSCKPSHASYVGTEVSLTGIDEDGGPILTPR